MNYVIILYTWLSCLLNLYIYFYHLDGSLGLDCSNGSVHVLGDDVSSEEQAAGHVLAMPWVTFDHLVSWFKARVGDLTHCELLMVGLLSRDDWGIGGQWEVNTGVGDKVCLELSQVNIQGTIEPQRSCD